MAEPPHKDIRPTRATDPEATTEAAALQGVARAPITSTDEAPPLVANRYEILGMLGAGGMGIVYRARDRELDEIVALKVLKKELAAAPGMLERFRREVKLARRVTHKNVARTFDIGDHEGDRFLTMELIEGEMLGAHLARRGLVRVRDAIAIARDVCSGLAAAHAAGVLHRDLKPENVIIGRDGRAVITDFGIARALAAGEPGRTAAGGMVGTPAYMAPEQVEGSTDLDARADLYALGTMLFELVTGKVAWPGDSVISIAAGRILRPPPDVRSHVPELPETLALVVLKLMARAKSDRYASAEEAGAAFEALAIEELPSTKSLVPASIGAAAVASDASSRAQRKAVAVLPLLNLGVEDDAYLAQTLTEDLVDLLCGVPQLRVRPRGETARFDKPTRDVREAGRVLDVDVVVDGSVRRIGDTVRVSVRLVAVEDGFQLWARRFDRPAADVLSVADDAASAVARALATERTAEARPSPGDAVAQDLYLRGRYLLHGGWFDKSREGVKLLRAAHERAPEDARIAGTYALAVTRVLTGDADSFDLSTQARELAERTLESHPAQAEARVALGMIHLNNGEGAGAAVQLKRALAVSPNSVEALDVIGRVLVEAGRTELGFATLRRALAIEPMLIHARQAIVRALALLGDMDGALELMGPSAALSDGELMPQLMLRGRFAMWHRDIAAAEALEREIEARPGLPARSRKNVLAVCSVAKTQSMSSEAVQHLQNALALDVRFMPRRLCFHAQMRVEMKLCARDVDGALADLRIADANGLLDLLWLDRCPLFDGPLERSEFSAVREAAAGRAERVMRVLDP